MIITSCSPVVTDCFSAMICDFQCVQALTSLGQPRLLHDCSLHGYQLDGFRWLASRFHCTVSICFSCFETTFALILLMVIDLLFKYTNSPYQLHSRRRDGPWENYYGDIVDCAHSGTQFGRASRASPLQDFARPVSRLVSALGAP